MDIDQMIGLLALLPPWAQHLLAYSALLSLVLGLVVKPAVTFFVPPERWPAWLRMLIGALDVAALNSATTWKLVRLGLTKEQLKLAQSSLPPPAPSAMLRHPLESPSTPWHEGGDS